jgi:hypothetical protein
MSFPEFWLAMGRTGNEGYARAKWGKLSATDKSAIRGRLGRPRSIEAACNVLNARQEANG